VNCYPFIEAEKAQQRSVKRACELLEVSRAAFYQQLAGPSRRDRADAVLAAEIRAVHKESRGRYGAPRVHAELRAENRRLREDVEILKRATAFFAKETR
jgi:transposase-like protein